MVALAVVLVLLTVPRGAAQTIGAVPTGPVLWEFQGSEPVAERDRADALARFASASAHYLLPARAGGQVFAQVGRPHVLLAAPYAPLGLDVLVLVAPVTDGGATVGLAGFYARDTAHHGIDRVVPLSATDVEVSADVTTFPLTGQRQLTVVVGGPRAGGLLVELDGVPQNVNGLPGAQVVLDRKGIGWLYPSVRPSAAQPDDGVLTLLDGALDLEHVLYHGRPGVSTGTG